mmetsp:Transcript_7875/g.15303  ORF Transcript_7875/g.15303 Transcript_7875/m.15303 type:complete len:140 (-) Transcript_7875:404-823(-)
MQATKTRSPCVCGTRARATTKATIDNREHLVYVEHEPSQQRNQRKAYSDRSTLPDHLLKNSYLHNTTPSEVSNRTDRKPVTDAKTPSIKQEAIVYSTGSQGAQRHGTTNRWWILYKTRAFYTSTGTIQPIPHLDQSLTT